MLKLFIKYLFFYSLIPFLFLYVLLVDKKRSKIIWGPVAMINYKYWSNALKKIGYDSVTLVSNVYKIYDKKDFDIYFTDVVPKFLRINNKVTLVLLGPIFSFLYSIKNASIVNSSFIGCYLGNTPIWFLENFFYKIAKIKIVISGFGGDSFLYSRVDNYSLRHALLMSYPNMSKKENEISKKIMYWTKNADAIIVSSQIDGIGRWTCLPLNSLCIDNNKIISYQEKRIKDFITIVHSPNHRGFKGTEFILDAIKELKEEGYKINFILLENVKNVEVLRILREEADILIEQIIYPGYGLNAIEGIASNVAVLSNLPDSLRLFRRYSYLKECPILSTNPENIKENLKLLIENKELREELGRLGIEYVKKYHSEESAQYMYGKIYNQLLNGVDEDLINMYHPLKSEYNKKNYINTPLVNNQYVESDV